MRKVQDQIYPLVMTNHLPTIDSKTKVKINDITFHNQDNYVLAINGNLGAWAILTQLQYEFLKGIPTELILEEVYTKFQDSEPWTNKIIDEFITNLYIKGLVELNSLSYTDIPKGIYQKSYLSFILLKLTYNCNLACTYCYAADQLTDSKSRMTLETGVIAIKKALETCSDTLAVVFHGGEPTLYKKTLIDIVLKGKELAKSAGKNIEFGLQTNGTLITDEFAEFLSTENIPVGFSIDNYGIGNNTTRIPKGNFDLFERCLTGIETLLTNNVTTGLMITITSANDKELDSIVEAFSELGLTDFKFSLLSPIGLAQDKTYLLPNPEEVFQSYKRLILKVVNDGLNVNPISVYHYVWNLIYYDKPYMCLRSPCGAGKYMISVEPDGEVFPCDCYIKDTARMGNIIHNTLEEITSTKFENSDLSLIEITTKCKNCDIRHFCGGGCPGSRNDITRPYSIECSLHLKLIPFLMNELTFNDKLIEKFDNWCETFKPSISLEY